MPYWTAGPDKILETIATEVAKRLIGVLSAKRSLDATLWSSEHLKDHLIQVASWSERIEFFGFSRETDTDSDSIALLTSLPRKFQQRGKVSDKFCEGDLLEQHQAY